MSFKYPSRCVEAFSCDRPQIFFTCVAYPTNSAPPLSVRSHQWRTV